MRKILGAERKSLVLRFLGESVLFSYVSLSLALILVLPYFFLGLSVVHALTLGMQARTVVLTIFYIALVVLLMASLYTISDATSNSATFGRYYHWLLFFNALGLIALLLLIVHNVYKLVVQYRLKAIGSRLTARMISVFVLLTIIQKMPNANRVL